MVPESACYFWPLPSRAATLTIALSAAKSITPALARFLRTVSPHVYHRWRTTRKRVVRVRIDKILTRTPTQHEHRVLHLAFDTLAHSTVGRRLRSSLMRLLRRAPSSPPVPRPAGGCAPRPVCQRSDEGVHLIAAGSPPLSWRRHRLTRWRVWGRKIDHRWRRAPSRAPRPPRCQSPCRRSSRGS